MNFGEVAKNLLLDKTCMTCVDGKISSAIVDKISCSSARRARAEFDLKTNSTEWRDFRDYGLKLSNDNTCEWWWN